MMQSRSLVMLIAIILLVGGIISYQGQSRITGSKTPEPRIVISLGKDLTSDQKQIVRNYFNEFQRGREVRLIAVSNAEERKYLQGIVDESLIGTRAVSSAYCELLDKGSGIEVQTENITAITPFMYTNALTTAGIKDARVIVAAPFKVSGTAALTGITKAFESASQERLKEDAKKTANKEIAETTQLGEEIGKNNAEKIIFEVKRRVIDKNTSRPDEIRKIIIDVAADLNIGLTDKQIEPIISLMQKINSLNININDIDQQLKNLERNVREIKNTGEETTEFIKRLIKWFNELMARVQNLAR